MKIDFKDNVPRALRSSIRQVIDEAIMPHIPEGVSCIRVSQYPGGIAAPRGTKLLQEPYAVRLIGPKSREIERYGHHIIHKTDHGLAHMWLAGHNRVTGASNRRKAS